MSELASCKKAAVLIPFPFASDDHQKQNAQALVSQGAAQMILQKDFTPEKFVETLRYFNSDRSKLKQFEDKIQRFHMCGAADNIAAEILKFK